MFELGKIKKMRNETLFEIYKSIVKKRKMLKRVEVSEYTKIPYSTVCKAFTVLRHAGLIKEHYIEKQSRFGVC